MLFAVGGLFLFDRFSLPRLHADDTSREFLARLTPHLRPGVPLYYFDPNEDVLGRLCLALPRDPIREYDRARAIQLAQTTRALLLAEPSKLGSPPGPIPQGLTILESGKMGNKRMVLLSALP